MIPSMTLLRKRNGMTTKAKPDRIIFLQNDKPQNVRSEFKEITKGSTFLYEKEHELSHVLLEAFSEMAFLVYCFEKTYNRLITNPPAEVKDYINQLNETSTIHATNCIIEFHSTALSTYFKTFLILSKTVLDKIVPFYSYIFSGTLYQFDKKGKKLLDSIKRSKHVPKKDQMIELIEGAKSEWINSLISLRDQYVHHSNLRQYKNFWAPGEWVGSRKFKGLSDFHKPMVEVAGKEVDALKYMLMIKAKLVIFLNKFLLFCEFTPGRRPKCFLRCDCGYQFAKKIGEYPKGGKIQFFGDLKLEIKDQEKRYGVIVCPKCGDKTDTDLDFWPQICIRKEKNLHRIADT